MWQPFSRVGVSVGVITDRSFKKKGGGGRGVCVILAYFGEMFFFFPSTSSQRVLKSLCATINLGIDPFAKNQAKWRESEEGDEDTFRDERRLSSSH